MVKDLLDMIKGYARLIGAPATPCVWSFDYWWKQGINPVKVEHWWL